ncbi:MAG: hypothetical protein AAGF67_00375, partial [Verrucomicrobiota bacterium]
KILTQDREFVILPIRSTMSLTQYSPPSRDPVVPFEEGRSESDLMVDPLIDRHDFAYLLRKHWKIIFFLPVVLAVLVTGWKVTQQPIYESSAMLLVDSSLDTLLQFEGGGGGRSTIQESLRSLEVAVVADSVVLRVVEKLDLRNSAGFLPKEMAANPNLPDAKLLGFVQKNRIKASLQPETRIIKITARDPNQERARLVAVTFVEEFQSFLADQRRGEVEEVRELIEAQVVEAKKSALEAEKALKQFRENAEDVPLDQDHGLFAARLTQFGADLNEAVRARVELEGINESLQQLPENTPALDVVEIAGYRSDSHFVSLMTSLYGAQSRLAAAKEQFTASHPTYLAAEAEAKRYEEQIEDFAGDLVKTVNARFEAARKREGLLRLEVAQLQNGLIEQKSRGSEFRAASEEVENRWLHYKTLQQRLSENIISTEMPGSIATMVSEPLTPFKAAGPPTFIFTLAGGFAGLFLVVLFLAGKILFGVPYSNAEQLEERFRLPVIADWSSQNPDPENANAMMPYLLGGHAQVIQVSAPGLPEESAAVAERLALSLSERNRKTLLIRVKPEEGNPRIMESGRKHLNLLTLSPNDIFDSTRFSAVLPKLRGSYEKILIEAGTLQNPPLLEWISSYSDREVMAVAHGTTRKSEIARRVRRLKQENDTRIGFLFIDPIHPNSARSGRKALPANGTRRGLLSGLLLKHGTAS